MTRRSHSATLTIVTTAWKTPIGVLRLYGCSRGLLAIALPTEELRAVEQRLARCLAREGFRHLVFREDAAALGEAQQELAEYFASLRQQFTVPVYLCGTPFQQQVWTRIAMIPYGMTWTYREVAERSGSPAAVRAIGAALAANPVPIVVPCHRVVGARGELRGYAGGLALKQHLLAHERAVLERTSSSPAAIESLEGPV
ncbi:methylated-DNA--[protein]-cysteine S-methyltransferase [Thermomicrobium sp. 4228-Ro]|uniref:methylated-DNA--[protein]-cysteine S-methyltransferase n=1 Tax=Thermomicrobium sp. 4228-Ro TaxID=2993937 RepID=UPI002248857F|nr:methylated-DNA--[protein]-cysteine S-methyltransferase [Thermomicrobium sp. 4228-Ro]MCX2727375.1 methylated-DNA--[protein]-cysteine S-methyltransferase [Thermomicrobium sp. 4228-Ro]